MFSSPNDINSFTSDAVPVDMPKKKKKIFWCNSDKRNFPEVDEMYGLFTADNCFC
jgi:hypothetical protein